MFLLQFLSSTLFVVPICVTFGIYFGVDHERILRCGFHCGEQTDNPYSDSTSNPGFQVNVTNTTYCQKSIAVTPPPGRYIFNPNQWGDTDDVGDLCLNFTTSGLGGSDYHAAGWEVTWMYPQGSIDSPVHAFPNADLELPDILPIQVTNMSELILDVAWSYNTQADTLSTASDYTGLDNAELNANVCLDMFLDPTGSTSSSPISAKYEVMVWIGRFGTSTDPIGWSNGSLESRSINGTSFDLFAGNNSVGQHVLTWLAQTNVTEFTGDVAPLLRNLSTDLGPTPSDYLGYVAFGSETLWSNRNVTFYVPRLEMDVTAL